MANETYTTMILHLRERLDEVGVEGFWKDAELLRYCVEGARDVSRKSECNRAKATIAFSAGDYEKTGPTDAIRVHRCEWKTTGQTRIVPLTYQDFDSMDAIWYTQQATATGEPSWWTTWGFPPNLTMKLFNVPVAAGSLYVYYYRLAALTTTAGDSVDVVAGWEDVVVDHACYKAMMKDRDSRWQSYKQLYDENLASLMDTAQKFTDTTGQITTPSGAGVPAFLWNPNYMD